MIEDVNKEKIPVTLLVTTFCKIDQIEIIQRFRPDNDRFQIDSIILITKIIPETDKSCVNVIYKTLTGEKVYERDFDIPDRTDANTIIFERPKNK